MFVGCMHPIPCKVLQELSLINSSVCEKSRETEYFSVQCAQSEKDTNPKNSSISKFPGAPCVPLILSDWFFSFRIPFSWGRSPFQSIFGEQTGARNGAIGTTRCGSSKFWSKWQRSWYDQLSNLHFWSLFSQVSACTATLAAVSNKSEPAKLVDPLSLAKSRVDENMLRRNMSGDADSDDHDEEHDDAEDETPHAADNTLPSNTKKRKHKSMYKGGNIGQLFCWRMLSELTIIYLL